MKIDGGEPQEGERGVVVELSLLSLGIRRYAGADLFLFGLKVESSCSVSSECKSSIGVDSVLSGNLCVMLDRPTLLAIVVLEPALFTSSLLNESTLPEKQHKRSSERLSAMSALRVPSCELKPVLMDEAEQ